MTPNEQLVKTLERLLERSKKGQVNWQRTDQHVFEVMFQHSPQTCITLAQFSPEAAPDRYVADLFVDGEVAISINAEDGIDTDLFNLFHELWTQAKRSVVKWDLSLDLVNKALDSEEMVGAAPDIDDDLGF